jgi:hypothetical protein
MSNENQPGSNTPDPQYVTADQIGNIVNAALTARLPKMLQPAIEAALAPITAKLSAPPPTPPSGDDGDDKKKSKQTPEMAAMAKQIEDLTKGITAEREARAAAEKKQKEDRAYNELRQSLEGKVRPEFVDILAKNLFQVEGRVSFGDDGAILFKSSKAPYVGAEPEEVQLPLKNGVEDFLKSDAAKHYLPAPSGGSNTSPLPKRGPSPVSGRDFSKPATSDADKVQRALEREAQALAALGKIS